MSRLTHRLEDTPIEFDVQPLGDEPAAPRPDGCPDDLEIRWSAPMPVLAKRADLDIKPGQLYDRAGQYQHRLVVIGDSLTQGFKSLAIAEPWLSWPMIVAQTMGLATTYSSASATNPAFSFATFPGPARAPGLPLNLEAVLRDVDNAAGDRTMDFKEVQIAAEIQAVTRSVAAFWEHGDGSIPPGGQAAYHHNLAVWGFDVRDALAKSPAWCAGAMAPGALRDHFAAGTLSRLQRHIKDEFVVSFAQLRTVLRVLAGPDVSATQVSAVEWFGQHGGIETLIVALGANNALGIVEKLELHWSQAPGYTDLKEKDAYNIWAPEHFEAEYQLLVARIREVNAKHVILATVPHVTIVPLMRGVGEKPYYSRYFSRYTRPWITDVNFDPSKDPSLTGDEARAVDSAIDQYNYVIKRAVRDARNDDQDWYLLDLCGLLDRLAYRRYLASPSAQPAWFRPYELPAALRALSPRPDTRYLGSDIKGRTRGGLIALDGVHPTTIGYGILAQEVVSIMSGEAAVDFGPGMTTGSAHVDFDQLINRDTLIQDPPKLLDEALTRVAAINNVIDLIDLMTGKAPA